MDSAAHGRNGHGNESVCVPPHGVGRTTGPCPPGVPTVEAQLTRGPPNRESRRWRSDRRTGRASPVWLARHPWPRGATMGRLVANHP